MVDAWRHEKRRVAIAGHAGFVPRHCAPDHESPSKWASDRKRLGIWIKGILSCPLGRADAAMDLGRRALEEDLPLVVRFEHKNAFGLVVAPPRWLRLMATGAPSKQKVAPPYIVGAAIDRSSSVSTISE